MRRPFGGASRPVSTPSCRRRWLSLGCRRHEEMALCFEYELWQMLARQTGGRWASGHEALRRSVLCLVEALEAFEARLAARERLAVGCGTQRLAERQRTELRDRFCGDLAELLRGALPAAARLACQELEHGKRHLRCVEEVGRANGRGFRQISRVSFHVFVGFGVVKVLLEPL